MRCSRKKFSLMIFTLGCIVGSLFAFSGRNKMETAPLQPITVIGQVGVYGNEPHTWLGFVDQNGVEYGLETTPQLDKELRALQGLILELTGLLEPVPEGQPVGYQSLSGGKIKVDEVSVYKN